MTIMAEDYGQVWVCQCCMLVSANGECCEGWAPDETDDVTGETYVHFDREPLSAVPEGLSLTLGMSADEHDSNCPNHGNEWSYQYVECDCETRTHSYSSCDGCGSTLHGERHAAHLWKD